MVAHGQSYALPKDTYMPILLHRFSPQTSGGTVKSEAANILHSFNLFGKEKKVIVLYRPTAANSKDIIALANLYHMFGVTDILYLLIKHKDISIVGVNAARTKFIQYKHNDDVKTLFPDRHSNLSERPYYVACYEDPAITFKNKDNKVVGSVIELIDIIARHQSTTAQYIYTEAAMPLFEPGQNTSIDFATYRIIRTSLPSHYSILQLSTMFRWCIAVPKSYSRILHEQVIWPFALDMWILGIGLVAFFAWYQAILQKKCPTAYPIVNSPLQILKIVLLFLLSEYYTAMLTSNLGLSQLPAYPKTLSEFYRCNIPLLFPNSQFFAQLNEQSRILSRIVELNSTLLYNPSQFAIIQLCDRFRYTIGTTTKGYGKQMSHHKFHLITEPIRTLSSISPFRKTSPRLHRFQMYVSRLYEAGIWNYLVQKWNDAASEVPTFEDHSETNTMMLKLDHFMPVFIIGNFTPKMDLVQAFSQHNSSVAAMLISFLIRVIMELQQNHPIPSTIGLVNFNAHNLNYIPAYLIKRVSTGTFVNIDLNRHSSNLSSTPFTPILLHAFSTSHTRPKASPIQTEVLNTLQTFGLIGKEKRIIVILDPYLVKPTELDLLAKTYHHFGAIDIIYVLVKKDELVVVRLNDMATEFVMMSTNDHVADLFPDRLTNLSGRPYKVAYLENPPLSLRGTSTNGTIGIDIEFIDMIAKHQRTVAEYRYTPKPIKLFDPWHATTIDFATYCEEFPNQEQNVSLLFLPKQQRWCLAVPKTYNRILHEKFLWLYAVDGWVLIVFIVVCFLLYNLFFKSILQNRFPEAFPRINTPIHVLRIFLLFMVTEYYTALLSSNLSLSQLSLYPRTLERFQKCNIPLLVAHPESYHFIHNNTEMMARTVRWNLSQRYDPAGMALLELCDVFPYTIRASTKQLGRELNHHHYHLIKEPVKSTICISPFRRTSPVLVRFQMYARRLHEAGIWEHLVQKWTWSTTNVSNNALPDGSMLQMEHFIPVYIIGGYLYLNSSEVESLNTRIVIHAIPNFSWVTNKISILVETLELIQNLGLYGKSKKVIILIDLRKVKLTEFEVLKQSYHHVGAIDILYVLEHYGQIKIMVPALNKPTKLVPRSRRDSVTELFPDRLSNLRGHPYKIACIENRPLTYRTDNDRIIGIDVDFIDIIAKHQNTIAIYKYTNNPIQLFTSWYDIKYDLATYRIKHEGLSYPFKPLYFPNQFRWCLAVPKTYNRVIHEQVIWPYKPSLWTLILSCAGFFVLYKLILKQLFQTRFPNAFPIINTPLQILRIMLLFLLTEYYTAKLTAILGLSEIPDYPKTLAEFANSPIPLIVSESNDYQYLLDNPEVHAKTIEWNFTKKYDPSGLALLQLCDLFPFTIDDTTDHLGKRHSYHHYHLIDEPISTSICLSPFRKTSPRLERFQLYVTRLNEAGIWNHLMSKWVLKDGHVKSGFKAQERKSFKSSILQLPHFIPVYVIAGYLYLIALIIFILEQVVYRLHRRFEQV
uniref:Uncharacterized protein n=1 Tax=Anopheles minimus TaxID=112268 RepID=A0A182WC47_9DIPT